MILGVKMNFFHSPDEGVRPVNKDDQILKIDGYGDISDSE
jgi:hypothetical protein